jgi:hypothetical protein
MMFTISEVSGANMKSHIRYTVCLVDEKKFCPSNRTGTLVMVMEAAVGVGTMPMVLKNISTKEVRKW